MIVNPGIRRFLGSAVRRLFNSAAVDLPLTHSAIPTRGSVTPAFTRATTATFTDWEGVLRTVPSGCARFEGGRMVRNLVPTKSEDSSADAWVTNVNSSATVTTVTFDTPNASFYYKITTVAIPAGNTVVFRAKLTSGTKTGVMLRASDPSVGTGAGAVNVILTATPTVFSVTATNGTASASTFIFGFENRSVVGASDTSAGNFTVEEWQLEDVTGQADQTASEYVSVGATPINLCLQSQTIATAPWTLGNGIAVTADQYVAPDGTTTVDKLTALAGNTQHFWYQGIATTAGAATYSVYLRYVNNQWARIGIYDGAASYYAAFDILNGVAGSTLGSITTTAIEPVGDGVTWRVSITATIGASALSQVYLSVVDADDPSFGLWNAAGTEAIGAWGAQLQTGSAATTYIPTTTVAKAYNEYHGAGVDGVEFFNTDRDGAVIPAATNTGYLAEGARTNLILSSDDLTNGTYWAASGSGVAAPTLTIGQVDPSRTTKAVKLAFPAVSGAGNFSIFYASPGLPVAVTAAPHANTWYLKGEVGGEQVYIMGTPDGITYLQQLVTLTTEFQRFQLVGTPFAASWYWQIGVDLRDGAQTAKGAQTIYASFPQLELDSSASTYTATGVAAVTRAADVLTYPSAGNIDGTVGWCYADVTSSATNATQTIYLAGTGAGGYVAYHDADGVLKLFDVSAARSLIAEAHPNTTPNTTPNKIAVTWGGVTCTGAVNASVGSAQTFDGNISIAGSDLAVGSNASGVGQIFGTIRNVRIGQRQLSASEMQAITFPDVLVITSPVTTAIVVPISGAVSTGEILITGSVETSYEWRLT